MAEAAISATVEILVRKLIDVLAKEISLSWGVKNELKGLEESLETVQAFLYDASRRQVEDKQVKLWLKKLEKVAYEADVVLDEFNSEILRRKVEIRNQMKRKVRFFFSNNNPMIFRLSMAHKIKNINMKLVKVNEEATNHGIREIVADSAIYLPSVMETDSISVDPIILGRENDVPEIVNMLVNPGDEVVSIVPIIGMGGLGKTTLARLIFNNPRTMRQFDERIWVCVSENFDTTRLLKRILETLMTDVVHLESKEAIIKKLQEKLKDKRYLLVLDDFWNDQRIYWEDFKSSLLGINPNQGNFCLVTTRSEHVASIVSTRPAYHLDKLSDDDCWSLIKSRAFLGGEVPQELEIIGKDIASRCRGVPLAAIMVGATLQGKDSYDWTSFLYCGFSSSNREESGVLQVLKVSFDRLPSPFLKKCFTHCSIFPKGAEIEKEWLVQLWMAEGFCAENYENDMECVGERVYDFFLENSFLQDAAKDKFGNIKRSKMHDLVHDLACLVSKTESFTDENSTANSIQPQVGHLTAESLEGAAYKKMKEEAIYLRTLFLGGDKICDKVFKDFKNLHILILRGRDVIELTSSIGKLIHLRFLDVSSSKIKAFPESTCKLLNLQTLRAIHCFCLARLPDRFQQLVSLRHLNIWKHARFQMPRELGKLTCLRTLEFFNVGHEKGHRIEELGFLKKLKGKLVIRNLERVNDKEEAAKACLIEKPNIYKLKFIWSQPREGTNNSEEVLEGLQPHQNIKGLTIEGFPGDNFPSWTLHMTVGEVFTLNKLIEIKLVQSERCQEIPTLGHLPMLKVLDLVGLRSVKSIGHSFYYLHGGNESSSSGSGAQPAPFRALESFRLVGLINLVEWIGPSKVDVFPKLQSLQIERCNSMTIAPSHDFPSLEELKVEYSSSLLLDKICASNISSLISLEIKQVGGLTCLPKKLMYNNQHLQVLEIRDCDSLTHLEFPDSPHNFKPLQKLIIDGCYNLKSIQYSSGELFSLRTLKIGRCVRLIDFPTKMLESCTSLERLEISNCYDLTSSFRVECQKMPLLYYLDISKCPKLRSLPMNINCLSHLRELSIGPFSEELGFTSFCEALQGIQRLQSLRELYLHGWTQWESFPDQLQHLTALTHLGLDGFGIQVLPEWIGNLLSLEEFIIFDLKRLRYLPSKEAIQRLTKLCFVSIRGCPLLDGINNPESHLYHSEWPKISHVYHVSV